MRPGDCARDRLGTGCGQDQGRLRAGLGRLGRPSRIRAAIRVQPRAGGDQRGLGKIVGGGAITRAVVVDTAGSGANAELIQYGRDHPSRIGAANGTEYVAVIEFSGSAGLGLRRAQPSR